LNAKEFAYALLLWQNYLAMGHRLPRELLDELRTYLQHFDDTDHLGGEIATVAEIKRRLRTRIAEVEAELRIKGDKQDSLKPNRPN
jgi:hypothetical protein